MRNKIKTVLVSLLFLVVGAYLYAATDKYLQAVSSSGTTNEATGFINFFFPIIPYFGFLGLGVLFIIDLAYIAYLLTWLLTRNKKIAGKKQFLELP